MENVLDINEFNITELETVEAPLTDYEAGVAVGVTVGVGVFAIAAVAAC